MGAATSEAMTEAERVVTIDLSKNSSLAHIVYHAPEGEQMFSMVLEYLDTTGLL